MPYLDLTTTEQIRAVLAAEFEDIQDETIEAQGLEDDLLVALSSALPKWREVMANAAKPANQARLRIFAKYFCAATIGFMAQAIFLKKVSDGSNERGRSDKDGWAFVAEGLMAKATVQIEAILDDLGQTPVLTPATLIGRVVPDRDPITTPRS